MPFFSELKNYKKYEKLFEREVFEGLAIFFSNNECYNSFF